MYGTLDIFLIKRSQQHGVEHATKILPYRIRNRSLMAAVQRPPSSNRPPRKVIAGTVMQSYWEPHPG